MCSMHGKASPLQSGGLRFALIAVGLIAGPITGGQMGV